MILLGFVGSFPCTLDSVEVETRDSSDNLLRVTYICPCAKDVKAVDYQSNPSGDTWELVSYDKPEICGNGIDDNCNGEADESWPCLPTTSTVSGTEEIQRSSILNNLALILIPAGGVILLRFWRGNR